jgi:hypothetical protein
VTTALWTATSFAFKMGMAVVHYGAMAVQSKKEPVPTPDAHEVRAHVRAKGEEISEYTAQAVLDMTGDSELAEIALTMDPRPTWVQDIACRWH